MKNIKSFKKYLAGRILANFPVVSSWFLKSFISYDTKRLIMQTNDPVRYGAIHLAIKTILENNISGSFAEGGVYKGVASRFISDMVSDRKFFLFDTFDGFLSQDLGNISDGRFKDTNIKVVMNNIKNKENIIIKKGNFPDTTKGLEEEKFAFVMLDFDKFRPTLSGLNFFYPRLNPGGYIFLHDYNSPESDWACSKALNQFIKDKPDFPIGIPDKWGTVILRKANN